jgi:hypothetical protein
MLPGGSETVQFFPEFKQKLSGNLPEIYRNLTVFLPPPFRRNSFNWFKYNELGDMPIFSLPILTPFEK